MFNTGRSSVIVLLLIIVLSAVAFPQDPAAATSTVEAPFQPRFPGVVSKDLLSETQFTVRQRGYAGLIWWIPTEFWQVSSESQGKPLAKDFKALDDYTVVAIFFAKVGTLGNFDFAKPEDISKNAVLVDSAGNEYPVIKDVSSQAEMLSKILKPMLASAMGRAGENLEMLYFPAVGKNGKKLLDATEPGSAKVLLRNMLEMKDEAISIKTPLTSLASPKFCPVDHERMSGSWKYCPWHGVALGAASDAVGTKK